MQHSGTVSAARVGVLTRRTGPPKVSCDRCGRQRELNTKRSRASGPSVCRDCRDSDPEYVRLLARRTG
jgi:hypothetical protein